MIDFQQFSLENGLKVIVHQDKTTPIVAFNLTYNVGAKDENPERTGFAHLFEHLMFGGSINIPAFDTPLQEVGGDNNAFTSTDITNYYITLPKTSLETAFWLESDRMLSLAFSEKSLSVQRNVVIEEFKQRYLNQPYGDASLLIRPLAYKKHPYQWPTIGKKIEHIAEATLEEVKDFFYKFYRPNNAILSVAGDVTIEEIKAYAEKWFGGIERGAELQRKLPQEKVQTKARSLTVERDVPLHAIYKAYHMVGRSHPDYYAFDLLSDILSRGNSSRFNRRLIKGKKLFTDVQAYVSGESDPGLFTMAGYLNSNSKMEDAEKALISEIHDIQENGVREDELTKVKNKLITVHEFAQTKVLNKAMSLGIAATIDTPDLVNLELENYKKVRAKDIQRIAKTHLKATNCSTLYYLSKNINNG